MDDAKKAEEAMQKQAEAMGHIMQEIYVPAFIKKCAEHGLQFTSEEQLKQALETTAKIEAVQAAQTGQDDPIAKAAAAMNELVGELPKAPQAQKPHDLSPEAVEALVALI